MSEGNEIASPSSPPVYPGRHAGEVWSYSEQKQLVEGIRGGLIWEDIALQHGRSLGAVRSRASLMLPLPEMSNLDHDKDAPGATGAARPQADSVRELLAADPDYDWLTPTQQRLRQARPASRLWTPQDETDLAAAWRQSTPLPELAARYSVGEYAIIRHLIGQRLATTLLEVTDRLGFTPGGTVELRRRFALDPSTVALVLLVGIEPLALAENPDAPMTRYDAASTQLPAEAASGSKAPTVAATTRIVDLPVGRVRHLSLHASEAAAAEHAADIEAKAAAKEHRRAPWSWVAMPRSMVTLDDSPSAGV
jgi:hypothetical protein